MKYWERYFCSAMLLLCLPEILCESIKYYDQEVDKNLWIYFLVMLAVAYEDIFEA